MNWQEDPEIRAAQHYRSVRMGILRSAVLWTPLFIVAFGSLLFFGYDRITGPNHGSTWFLVMLLSFFSLLLGYQSYQALGDLRAEPDVFAGEVTRRWSRRDGMVLKTHYVRIENTILRGTDELLSDVHTGDKVEARFFKRSGALLAITVTEKNEEARKTPARGRRWRPASKPDEIEEAARVRRR